MKKEKDISIIEWQPLPAPKDRYLLVRFHDEGELCSEMAYSNDGTCFQDDAGRPFYADIEAWAYFPYDVPTTPEDEAFEGMFPFLIRCSDKDLEHICEARREFGMNYQDILLQLKQGTKPSELGKLEKENVPQRN